MSDFEARLDKITTDLLPEVRATKNVNGLVVADLLQLTDELAVAFASDDVVDKRLVGKLWFVFTSLLAEASHTHEPGAILDVAWQYEDRLEKIFGPVFG
jgi:hypothetical protein